MSSAINIYDEDDDIAVNVSAAGSVQDNERTPLLDSSSSLRVSHSLPKNYGSPLPPSPSAKRQSPRPESPCPSSPSSDKARQPYMPSHNSQMYLRLKLYDSLRAHSDVGSRLEPPPHVLPASLFSYMHGKDGKATSIQTIFNVWVTMMGTSLLSMPWGFSVAGWGMGSFLICFIGFCCYYTCHMVLKCSEGFDDFGDAVRHYLGKFAAFLSFFSSVSVLVGAALVLLVIMSNAVYSIGLFYFDHTHTSIPSIWSATNTPFLIALFLFPILNLPDLSLLVKINTYGVISLFYMLFLLFYTDAKSGFESVGEVQLGNEQFIYLAGVLLVSFFIHNLAVPLFRNQKNPENNTRDLRIAFVLVAASYGSVGLFGYLTNADPRNIAQNVLSTMSQDDTLAFIGRILLLFQLIAVYPIVCYIMRIQLFGVIYHKPYPSWKHLFVFATVIVGVCTIVAVVYPHMGTILRYTGGVSGFLFVFLLPNLVFLKRKNLEWGGTKWYEVFSSYGLIVMAGGILICQFIM
eukprot:GCRY01004544.1.p1 GENE.GCRY01004544.1~~GCRY01004544.1.p1  ORF type:complete len:517 (-),score=42.56 GCRY01004544.1:247-1797(-)